MSKAQTRKTAKTDAATPERKPPKYDEPKKPATKFTSVESVSFDVSADEGDALEVTKKYPPQRFFSDPFVYWSVVRAYAKTLEALAATRCESLEKLDAGKRKEGLKKARAAKRDADNVRKAINSDAVKDEFASKPELLVDAMSAEQLQTLLAAANAKLAEGEE